jgi:hypothetical protein
VTGNQRLLRRGNASKQQISKTQKRRFIMKFRTTTIAFIFILAAFSLAQTATPTKPNATQPSTATAPATTKADCSCCEKMAEGKANESCCAHHQDASKSEAACCKGKDAKEAVSCMKGDKDKSADACCSNGKCGDGKEGCCSKCEKNSERAALACCGPNGEHCGVAHDHGDINK